MWWGTDGDSGQVRVTPKGVMSEMKIVGVACQGRRASEDSGAGEGNPG